MIPNFLDIHSSTAVEAFKLTCAPTKKALKALGKPGLRVAAKNVRFGVPYGRSAEALSRQCREEGADVSVAECQKLIDNYHASLSSMPASSWMPASRGPAANEPATSLGRSAGSAGSSRLTISRSMAEQGRSAKNYPIQNLVADAILLGMYNLRADPREVGLQDAFRVVLQIHDAVMLEVKIPLHRTRSWTKIVQPAMDHGGADHAADPRRHAVL